MQKYIFKPLMIFILMTSHVVSLLNKDTTWDVINIKIKILRQAI